MPTLERPTLSDVAARLRTFLPDDFPIKDDDPYSVWGTFMLLAAQGVVDVRAFIADLAPQTTPLTATGQWLDEHALSVGVRRIAASAAAGRVTVEVTQGLTIPAGSIFQTPADATGKTYRYTVLDDTAVPSPSGLVDVRAEAVGSAYNVGAARITTLVTALDGVTSVTNKADWLTSAGVDNETDDQLRKRLLLRWPSLSLGGVRAKYIFAALEVPGITKVVMLDQHPRGQGTADVVVAPPSGLPSVDQVAQVQAVIETRRPVTADVLARAPTTRPLDVTLTLYRASVNTEPESAWVARVQAVIDAQNIGQEFFPSKIADALHNFPDVQGVVITAPAAPIPLAADELITGGSITVNFA